MIKLKRAYTPPSADDGRRFLVDRLWRRGVERTTLSVEAWLTDLAPSDALREWFAHDLKKWAPVLTLSSELTSLPAGSNRSDLLDFEACPHSRNVLDVTESGRCQANLPSLALWHEFWCQSCACKIFPGQRRGAIQRGAESAAVLLAQRLFSLSASMSTRRR